MPDRGSKYTGLQRWISSMRVKLFHSYGKNGIYLGYFDLEDVTLRACYIACYMQNFRCG